MASDGMVAGKNIHHPVTGGVRVYRDWDCLGGCVMIGVLANDPELVKVEGLLPREVTENHELLRQIAQAQFDAYVYGKPVQRVSGCHIFLFSTEVTELVHVRVIAAVRSLN